MSKVYCPCGNVISNVGHPSQSNGWLITDCVLDSEVFEDALKKDFGRADDGQGAYCVIMDYAADVWECDKCGRIAIGASNANPSIKWFSPEDVWECDKCGRIAIGASNLKR